MKRSAGPPQRPPWRWPRWSFLNGLGTQLEEPFPPSLSWWESTEGVALAHPRPRKDGRRNLVEKIPRCGGPERHRPLLDRGQAALRMGIARADDLCRRSNGLGDEGFPLHGRAPERNIQRDPEAPTGPAQRPLSCPRPMGCRPAQMPSSWPCHRQPMQGMALMVESLALQRLTTCPALLDCPDLERGALASPRPPAATESRNASRHHPQLNQLDGGSCSPAQINSPTARLRQVVAACRPGRHSPCPA